jgi:hypothetical protein
VTITGHEGVGQAVGLHGEGHVLGQRGAADLLEHVQREHMVLAQPGRPLGKVPSQPLAHLLAHLHFHAVALAVVKTQGLDALIQRQRLRQAGGRILAAGEQHQRGRMARHRRLGGRRISLHGMH